MCPKIFNSDHRMLVLQSSSRSNRSVFWAMLCTFVLSMAVTHAQEKAQLSFREVVEDFAAENGKINGISLAKHEGASYAVAICDQDNRVSVSFGSAGRWRRVSVDKPYPKRVTVKLLDLDNDGRTELLVGSETLEVFRLAGQKIVRVWSSKEILGINDMRPRIELGDIDSDGQSELVVLNYKDSEDLADTKSLYVFEIENDKQLSLDLVDAMTLSDQHDSNVTAGLALGNFVGDKKAEITVGNDNGSIWLVELDDGKLRTLSQTQTPRGGAIGNALARANMDKDDHDELLVGTNGGYIFVCEFDGDNQARWIGNMETGRLAYGVAAADFDGDGIDEFVASRGHKGYAGMTEKDCVVEVFQFTDGVLRKKWARMTVDSPRPLLHDLNQDGRPEMIFYSEFGRGDKVDVIEFVTE